MEWRDLLRGAAQVGGDGGGEGSRPHRSALLYYSKWKNEDSARTFLRVYAEQLPRKYSGLVRRNKDEADASEQVYTTSEGDVLLSISGKGVFVSEGFPLELARKLRDSVASVQSDAPLQVAGYVLGMSRERSSIRAADPGLSLVRLFSSAGVMKAAMGEDDNCQKWWRPDDIL